MLWTPLMDRALLQVVDETPDATWAERAAQLSANTGQPVTDDMARNRHRRVLQDIELAKMTPEPKSPVDIPAVPQGDYAGFNIAFFDLETSSLDAWTGDLLCASIVDQFGNLRHATRFDFEQRSVLDDRGLVLWVRDNLEEFDIISAWNGFMFDQPIIQAKLIEHGERVMRDIMGLDLMYKARPGRYGVKVGSSKLKNVALWLNTPNQKPDVAPIVWRKAGIGDEDAIQELLERCDADCFVMRDIFKHLKPMIRTLHR